MGNFTEKFENKVLKTIKDHDLASKKNKIMVACSGGKDSTTILHILKKYGYNVEAGIVDLKIGKFSEINLENIKKFCKDNKIKLHIFDIRKEIGFSMCYVRSVLNSKSINLKSCAVCGIIKRYILNKKARELGFDRLVTGHNLDDEAQTFLMNQFKGNIKLSAKLGPRPGLIRDRKFIPRIKPLYFNREKDIEKYSKLNNFPVNYEICPCASTVFRRNLINTLDKYNFDVEKMVDYFLDVIPTLNKKYVNELNMIYCKECNEPSAKEICSRCNLIKMLKN